MTLIRFLPLLGINESSANANKFPMSNMGEVNIA
jgi:hypothetical protein